MKRLLLLSVFFVCFIISCAPFEDDLVSQDCVNNCTQISGELKTLSGEVAIGNVLARIRFTNNQTGSDRIVREKAVTEVDSNGFFDMQFEVRDDEVVGLGNYFIRFYVDSEEYYFVGNSTFRNWTINEPIINLIDQERNYKYLMPRRGSLKLEIENPQEMNQGDRLRTTLKVLHDTSFQIGVSTSIIGITKESPIREFDFMAGEQIQVELYKERNGTISIEYDTITIPLLQNRFEYKIQF